MGNGRTDMDTTTKACRIIDMPDAELARMVRDSVYAHNTRFGDGQLDAQYLCVLAVPYGKDEEVSSIKEALEAFFNLVQEYDYKERNVVVYDHLAGITRNATLESEEAFCALWEEAL